jgi:hypothetical protein
MWQNIEKQLLILNFNKTMKRYILNRYNSILLFVFLTVSCSKDSGLDSQDSPGNYYQSKDVEVLFENDSENGINILFMGDAYLHQDLKKIDGKYRQDALNCMDYLFHSQPFLAYKNHFNAYIIYAESSIKNTSNGIVVNYPFGSTASSGFFHNPYITNYTAVQDYVYQVKGRPMNSKDVVLMAVNDKEGGTATLGGNIAVFGTHGSTAVSSTVFATMLHELGHAFASLGDEYTIPNADFTQYTAEMANLDTINDLSLVKWKHFVGLPGYTSVGVYEGGGLQETGIWRPESSSIMMGNVGSYFNAPSREAIVKQIMNLRGVVYDFNTFLVLDAGNQMNKNSKNSTNEKVERISCGLGNY